MEFKKYKKDKVAVERKNTSPVCFADSPELRPEYIEEPDDMPESKGDKLIDTRDCD